ncbi:MAG: hypothetical protein LBL32_01590 [Holosporales bacterium]|nr:hypothetical protein [Holosporales bacterium]
MSNYSFRAIFLTLTVFLSSNCFADDTQTRIVIHNPTYNANPEVEKKIGMKTISDIPCTNGDLFMVSGSTWASKAVRAGISESGHSNPLGISHCGLIIIERPSKILSIIDRKLSGAIRSDYPVHPTNLSHLKEIIEQEYSCNERNQAAAFFYSAEFYRENCGVLILPVRAYLEEYNDNIYIRNIHVPYTRKFTRAFIRATLGMPYIAANPQEVLQQGYLLRIMRSVYGRGSDTYIPRMWCSELVARFYGIDHPCSVLPSDFSSLAKEDAVGEDLFETEIPVKLTSHVPSLDDNEGIYRFIIGLALNLGGLYDPMLRPHRSLKRVTH